MPSKKDHKVVCSIPGHNGGSQWESPPMTKEAAEARAAGIDAMGNCPGRHTVEALHLEVVHSDG